MHSYSRREMLRRAGTGLGTLGLAALLAQEGLLAEELQPTTPPDARNPLAPDARSIGASSCAGCHALEDAHASHGMHMSAFLAGSHGVAPQGACEACHGPGSEHAKRPDARGLIIAYTHGSATPVAVQAGTCQGCNMNVPPQLYNTLRTGLGTDICPACHRIIYAAEAIEPPKE